MVRSEITGTGCPKLRGTDIALRSELKLAASLKSSTVKVANLVLHHAAILFKRRNRVNILRVASFTLILSLGAAAHADTTPRTLWASSSNVLIRNESGSFTNALNSQGGVIGGIDFGNDGLMYAVSAFTNELIRIDTQLSTVQVLGNLGLKFIEGDIAFDPRDNRLFGVGSVSLSGFASLFSVDLSSGQASNVEALPFMTRNTDGIAIDGQGIAWIIDNGSPPSGGGPFNTMLHRFDLDSGTLLSTSDLGINFGYTGGLDFDPRTGELFYASTIGDRVPD